MVFYVYLYRDEFNTPIYVGKGKGKRAWAHLFKSTNIRLNRKLQKMIREGHNPQPEFLCKDVDEDFVLFGEIEAIRHYGRDDLGTGSLYNHTDGGEGRSGAIVTDETKDKLKLVHLRRKVNTPQLLEQSRNKLVIRLAVLEKTMTGAIKQKVLDYHRKELEMLNKIKF